jgi:hypothetical protein
VEQKSNPHLSIFLVEPKSNPHLSIFLVEPKFILGEGLLQGPKVAPQAKR